MGLPRRRPTAAVLVVLSLLGVSLVVPTAAAASGDDPEISDASGDANFLSPVTTDERDTRPASVANADIRAVWFETGYETHDVLDPDTGQVTGVEHRPTALQVHIETDAPVHPTQRVLTFRIDVAVPGCQASFDLTARQNADADSATLWSPCLGSNGVSSPVRPSYEGAVATMTFPLDVPHFAPVLNSSTAITSPAARVYTPLIAGQNPVIDRTATGRDFVVGQDIPPSDR